MHNLNFNHNAILLLSSKVVKHLSVKGMLLSVVKLMLLSVKGLGKECLMVVGGFRGGACVVKPLAPCTQTFKERIKIVESKSLKCKEKQGFIFKHSPLSVVVVCHIAYTSALCALFVGFASGTLSEDTKYTTKRPHLPVTFTHPHPLKFRPDAYMHPTLTQATFSTQFRGCSTNQLCLEV